MTKVCTSCASDGIQRSEERLVSGAVKRCVSCHGRGTIGAIRRKVAQWWTVKFQTNDGDIIRVTTRGTTENEASLNARKLLDPGLYCEML